MVPANLSKVMLAIASVMFALVMVTLAFAEDIDFTHDSETSHLRQAGVQIDLGICKTIFTRLPRTRGDITPPPAASRTILIPPSLDFLAHVPKKESRSNVSVHSASGFFSVLA